MTKYAVINIYDRKNVYYVLRIKYIQDCYRISKVIETQLH